VKRDSIDQAEIPEIMAHREMRTLPALGAVAGRFLVFLLPVLNRILLNREIDSTPN
jgi:hypothetical protein